MGIKLADIKVLARTPPAIMIVLGFLLIVTGLTADNPHMVEYGNWFIIGGVVLQILWILSKSKRL